jgi:hypothetical protein
MWIQGKWRQPEDIIFSEVNQDQRNKGHIFLSYVEIDPKDEHIKKTKTAHLHIHIHL